MKIIYSKDFIKSAKSISRPLQRKLSILLELLKENPFHSKLHTKPLIGELRGFYSFRITRDWRVIFKFFDFETIFLIDVNHRKDIYK